MNRLVEIAASGLPIAGVAAVTGWLVWHWLKRSEEPARLVVKWVQTLLVFVYQRQVYLRQFILRCSLTTRAWNRLA